ncbi:TNF receptor-associated factor homolog 1a-like isoform X2 [Papaver somniferum]|uniref:TNF receptor-associated factor homolog 1a-like isoform X2 n=1 Tax=Papaver somniferum TaxID=3469 RepID=UPI000E702F3C|nr:TNF receptor-associated factor homolog 1a-like isoform X2 [Papaver somniferum]
MERNQRPRAVFMAFGTKGDVYPIAAIAAAFASDQPHYHVILITHSAHQNLIDNLEDQNVSFYPITTPPVLSILQDHNPSGCEVQSSFSLQKKLVRKEHRLQCLSTMEKIFDDGPNLVADFILINFFALEGWNLAELFHVRCIVGAPYVVPNSAPSSFERHFKKEFPLLYIYLQEAPPHMDPVTGLPMSHNWPQSPLLLYGFSREVVEFPGYWPKIVRVCGFWFPPMRWQFSCSDCRGISDFGSPRHQPAKDELCTLHASLQNFLKFSASDIPIFIGLSSIGSMGFLKNPQVFLRVLEAVSASTNHKFILFTAAYQPLDAAVHEFEGNASSSDPMLCNKDGPKPAELYGKFTWKIDNFSRISKRELRSNAFEVPLNYPQGCDVCNHLSLFLCVANHDKLLPGWSHFAQFTIAVINKDPKKSKYSDTLHRFWKKEHDWGWKTFMELTEVMDGFIVNDTLVIKAQVQVIREKKDRLFRCLDCQYRRELACVYRANVEQICGSFLEEKQKKLGDLLGDSASFCAFWLGVDQNVRCRMSREQTDVILKVVVKQFFKEKEVTSTLVMECLYRGLKALEWHSKSNTAGEKRAALEALPPKDEKGPQNRTKDGTYADIKREENKLVELGRRTVEIIALTHIFSNKIEVAYQEAVALKRQEEFIREEEEILQAGSEQKVNDKEKRAKKKQSKQKHSSGKGKDKRGNESLDVSLQDKMQIESTLHSAIDGLSLNQAPSILEKPDTSRAVQM